MRRNPMPIASSAEDPPKPRMARAACALLLCLACAPAFGAEVLADCDASFARTLQPVSAWKPPPADARAVWLSRALVRWPGATVGARFRLYHSRSASIHLDGDRVVGADAGPLELQVSNAPLPAALAGRFGYLEAGPLLALSHEDQQKLPVLLRGQLLLVEEDARGRLRQATGVQVAGLLDDLYAGAVTAPALGAEFRDGSSTWRLWAPTAQQVLVCEYPDAHAKAQAALAMAREEVTGVWS